MFSEGEILNYSRAGMERQPKGFASDLRRFIEVYRRVTGQSVWLVRLESEYDPDVVLSRRLPPPSEFQFGEISFIEVALPQSRGLTRGIQAITSCDGASWNFVSWHSACV